MFPPCSATHFSAFVAVRLYTRTSWPACCRWPAIGYPMTPTPRNASFVILDPLAIVLSRISDYPDRGCKHKRGVARAGMTGLFKWLLRLAVAMVILCAVAGIAVYVLLSRSLPDYDKTMQVSGLDAPVEIVRDNANVPHVFGESDAAVFFGLGYAHAQDRLWQMTMLRRTAQGRLSEVFGPRTVEIDKLMRRFDIYGAARDSVEAQDAPTTTALDAYAKGVNARIAEINARSLGRGAPEMFMFDAPFSPWQPADSIAIIKVMAVQLSQHLSKEVLRARVSLALDDPARLN